MACHLRQILASPLFFANYVLHAAIYYPSPAELSHVMVLSERPRPTPHGHLQKEKQSPLRLITAECFFFFFFVVGMFPSNRILPSVDP
ncbi:BAL_1a_G0050070.mRNA.1.CDS.1 [Saccharomyces cerevisiae]|nr:BAL_1a_G0050070.mRNA.1.CDS.1 [Saccharomyces cerevisiae]CAI7343171.1 BAL_1a_G0050070.mRNA.1.CDS.1 [Saccharomyces cerevisiae]